MSIHPLLHVMYAVSCVRIFSSFFFDGTASIPPNWLSDCCKLSQQLSLYDIAHSLSRSHRVISVVFSTFPHIHIHWMDDMLNNSTFTTCRWSPPLPPPPTLPPTTHIATSKFVLYIFISILILGSVFFLPFSLRFFQFRSFSSLFLYCSYLLCAAVSHLPIAVQLSCTDLCLLYRCVEQYKISFFYFPFGSIRIQ